MRIVWGRALCVLAATVTWTSAVRATTVRRAGAVLTASVLTAAVLGNVVTSLGAIVKRRPGFAEARVILWLVVVVGPLVRPVLVYLDGFHMPGVRELCYRRRHRLWEAKGHSSGPAFVSRRHWPSVYRSMG